MTDLYDMSDLNSVFTQKCLEKFGFLSAFGFERMSITEEWYGTEIVYKNQTTGIKVSFETRENDIFLYLIRLINGEVPAYLDAPSRWFYLDNVVKLRAPSLNLPRKGFGEQLTPDDIDQILTAYAAALQEYAEDILSGNFSAFAELTQRTDRPRSWGSLEDVRIISSEEELIAQKRRLPVQIVEYYDTYFSEVRSQLQSPDLSSEAVPYFLTGFKRVISIGGKDGVVVAHFPIDLEITFTETDSGKLLLRFPSIPATEEDSYEFLQFSDASVSKLVELISGGEDGGIGDFAKEGIWGVRTFNGPQLKANPTTGEITWQSPWTRLVVADLYHLNYWEDTERALIEAEEDLKRENLEFYIRVLESGIQASAYEEVGDQDTRAEVLKGTEPYQSGEFGQIVIPEWVQVENLEFSTSKQAA